MNLNDIEVRTIDGETTKLSTYEGRVLLIVNTASGCGLTPQFEGLESLYRRFKDRGLEVLGFPCNQFGGQEPLDENGIKQFCSSKYDVSFPMFAKIDVNGSGEHPLYTMLKKEAPGFLGTKGIKWNFTKFLVDRKGKVVARFGPTEKPEAISAAVERALGPSSPTASAST